MFNKNSYSATDGYDTIVGSNSTLEGDFSADGKVRIDGKINGNVKINGELFMGETSLVLGNVSANRIETAGTIEGNVYSKGQLKLASTARLIGDVQVDTLSIEDGGQFHGVCSMSKFEKIDQKPVSDVSCSIEHTSGLKKKPAISKPQINEVKDTAQ